MLYLCLSQGVVAPVGATRLGQSSGYPRLKTQGALCKTKHTNISICLIAETSPSCPHFHRGKYRLDISKRLISQYTMSKIAHHTKIKAGRARSHSSRRGTERANALWGRDRDAPNGASSTDSCGGRIRFARLIENPEAVRLEGFSLKTLEEFHILFCSPCI